MKILGIGNALVDVLIKLENENFLTEYNIPKGSMQLVNREFANMLTIATKAYKPQVASGGSAANTIHGIASLGGNTTYIGKIGDDDFGNIFSTDLTNNKINPVLLHGTAETGKAITFITPDSERTFATYLGAAVELAPSDIKAEYFKGIDILHLEGYLVFNNALVEKIVKLAKGNNVKISLDLASYNVVDANKAFLENIIKEYIDIVFANEEEAKALTGMEPEAALVKIAEITDIAVVKIGSKGSYVKQAGKTYKVDAIKANAIDTTGAGDLFASGFLYGLSNNWTLDKCARLGSLTAGKVVETLGAKINSTTWNEINAIKDSI